MKTVEEKIQAAVEKIAIPTCIEEENLSLALDDAITREISITRIVALVRAKYTLYGATTGGASYENASRCTGLAERLEIEDL